MPRTPTPGHPAGHPGGHRHRNHHRPPDPLPEPGAHRGVPAERLPRPLEVRPTAEDEVVALRGSDGLTDIEREALAHRYDVVVRTTT